MQYPLQQTWNLDSIFSGGSGSDAFERFLQETEVRIEELSVLLQRDVTGLERGDKESLLADVVDRMQAADSRLREASGFTGCLSADNMMDKQAVLLEGRVQTLSAALQSALTRLDRILTSIPDGEWAEMMCGDRWQPLAFNLQERRLWAREKLPPEQEALAGDLAVDGYRAWSSLYDTAVRHFSLSYRGEKLSAGQAANKLHAADRQVRQEMFQLWETAWEQLGDFCGDALNRIAGFRLQLYKHRGWTSVLKEPLEMNRMSERTLAAMWETIEKNKAPLVRYLERKARLLGVERLAWHDVDAPLTQAETKVSYDEGAGLIVEQFRRFSPRLADFAELAFMEKWIEAEDRPGKSPGGFCTSFPLKKETRIFMTYSGTASNVSTLAHELGHGYHQYVMTDLPALNQDYAMNVAETASTFAEMIVSDAALRRAGSKEEKLALLDDKLQRAVAFMMNIHARFLFETRFYEERRNGLVAPERLSVLMQEAQQEAYCGALAEYHPLFWASKLHFYLTDVPFYNFPYTFGFLFSSGLYAMAEQEGESFQNRYVALLRDTGRMRVEELARQHLGVDLEDSAFWQTAIDVTLRDVEEFLALTE